MPRSPVQRHSNAKGGAAEPLNKIIKNNERTSVAIVGVLELYTTLKWSSQGRSLLCGLHR